MRFGHADLLAQWDEERNEPLKPSDVSRCDSARVWWRGECGHSWQLSVRTRAFNDAGCPYCGRRLTLEGFNSAECLDVGILHLWHPTENGDLKPSQVSDRTAKRTWLQCPTCGYEWRENLRGTRKESRKCPSCHRGRGHYLAKGSNDLGSKRPDVARQLDPELNGDLGPDGVRFNATKQVWWKGDCGHEWRMSPRQRAVEGLGCPYCSGHRVLAGFNDLASQHSELLAEWDWERNGDLKPTDVIANSNKRVWWKCREGHEWSGLIVNRARRGKADPGCPYCSGRKRPERPIRLD